MSVGERAVLTNIRMQINVLGPPMLEEVKRSETEEAIKKFKEG